MQHYLKYITTLQFSNTLSLTVHTHATSLEVIIQLQKCCQFDITITIIIMAPLKFVDGGRFHSNKEYVLHVGIVGQSIIPSKTKFLREVDSVSIPQVSYQ